MIDERLKTKDERTKCHPVLREGGNLPRTTSLTLSSRTQFRDRLWMSSWRSIRPIGSIQFLFTLIFTVFLTACTDYVQKMDDDFDKWEQAQKQTTLSSSSKSSSSVILSGDSREKSSSNTEKKSSSSSSKKTSSSSIKLSSSNKALSSSGQKNNSSSSIKATSSSTKAASSTSTKSSSSSTKIVSSSSSKKNEISSSSENVKLSSSGKASWAYLNSAISYGEIVDNRDGQVYKTVKIGEQTWMAENLNLETENSTCHEQNSYLCPTFKYGKLYQWSDAMDSIGIYSSDGKDCGAGRICNANSFAHGICPQDWHLPSIDEWITLCKTIKESPFGIQAVGFEKWTSATNIYGFSAIPAGHHTGYYNNIVSEDYSAEFWSSTEISGGNQARFFQITPSNFNTNYVSTSKKYGLSVRCIKNENNSPISSSSKQPISSSNYSSSSDINEESMYDEKLKQLKDFRDNQVYKTTVVGAQIWMAQNLNFETENSYCYNDSAKYCAELGRLYTWETALQACPKGWHLPAITEFEALFETVGGQTTAGKMLKATNGWNNNEEKNGNGSDAYSFSIIPAGLKGDGYAFEGSYANFWSSTEQSSEHAYYIDLWNYNDSISTEYFKKVFARSVRCIKD